MTTPSPTSFVKNEPVVVGAIITWLFSVAGTFILGHTHLVTAAQWSSLTTFLVPAITAVVLAVLAKVVREFVAPKWKLIEGYGQAIGLTPEEIEQLISDAVNKAIGTLPTVNTHLVVPAGVESLDAPSETVDLPWSPPADEPVAT